MLSRISNFVVHQFHKRHEPNVITPMGRTVVLEGVTGEELDAALAEKVKRIRTLYLNE